MISAYVRYQPPLPTRSTAFTKLACKNARQCGKAAGIVLYVTRINILLKLNFKLTNYVPATFVWSAEIQEYKIVHIESKCVLCIFYIPLISLKLTGGYYRPSGGLGLCGLSRVDWLRRWRANGTENLVFCAYLRPGIWVFSVPPDPLMSSLPPLVTVTKIYEQQVYSLIHEKIRQRSNNCRSHKLYCIVSLEITTGTRKQAAHQACYPSGVSKLVPVSGGVELGPAPLIQPRSFDTRRVIRVRSFNFNFKTISTFGLESC